MYDVPCDIINAILDDLTLISDWKSIRALSLTCKTLLEPCQQRLFNTVVIDRKTYSELHSAFGGRLILASYVLHLHYYINETTDVHRQVSLLQRFSQLQSLHLIGNNTRRGTVWNDVPMELQTQLTQLLHSPNLESLLLTCILQWPMTLFGVCTNLRQLNVGALGLDDTDKAMFSSPPFPPTCRLRTLSLGSSTFNVLDHLLTARWPNGSLIFDMSLLTILQDHSVHAPIQRLTNICGNQIKIIYFACLNRFRMLASSNDFHNLRVIIGNAHWNDLKHPLKTFANVEEIYLIIRPTGTPITFEHITSWIKPAFFPKLRSFIAFQEYGVDSKTMVCLPFINGPADVHIHAVKNAEEFWAVVSSATGISIFDR